MDAIFFTNKHHAKKALFVNTAYEVHRQMTFEQFIVQMKTSTTVVPYAPRRTKIRYGLLGTKQQPTQNTYDANNNKLEGNFTRSKEHIQEKGHLLCIDIDVHLLLEVHAKLTNTRHNIYDHLPDEDTIETFLLSIGLDIQRLNHLIYKSTSYGKVIGDASAGIRKKNMHIWLELKTRLDTTEQSEFVDSLFRPINHIIPRQLRGLNRQLKVRTAPAAPDMSVYSAARLLIQGDLTDRVISSKHNGTSIRPAFVEKTLKEGRRITLDVVELYTKETLREHTDSSTAYNIVNNTNISPEVFEADSKRAGRVLQSGELFLSDPVYITNKLYGTFGTLKIEMVEEAKQGITGSLFAESKDVTTNISDILDPVNGNSNNCYVVLKPDGGFYVYHYSEARWFLVLNRDSEEASEVTVIEKYLPAGRVLDLYDNHCIIAPTGTGKTFHVISKVLQLLKGKHLTKVVWTVPDYAALLSIEAEVKNANTEGVRFKAIHAGVDKFDAFEDNDFVLCTMSKLQGELQSRVNKVLTFDHSRIDFGRKEDTVSSYDLRKWSFVIDEVHTLFNAHGQAESFMYYRILQRELLFDRLLVMSASMASELLPGHHDRDWIPTTTKRADWVIDTYNLKEPRKVKVTAQFPWGLLLSPETSSALVMAPTALKAVGIYEEVQKAHPSKKALLYIGLPRNAAELSVQKYPYIKDDGSTGYREYERPSNKDLNEADFVIATALTAGASLARPYDYCIVDMQGIPSKLEVRSVEVQKISRARHTDVKRILVLSPTRFERGDKAGLTKQPLRTKTQPMLLQDYTASKQLTLNKQRTDILSPELNGGMEVRLSKEAGVVKQETPTFIKEHVLTFEPPQPVKQHIEQDILARFDIHKAASTYYAAQDRYEAFNRDSYEGSWGGGLTSYIDEAEMEPLTVDLGKDHAYSVREHKKRLKVMSGEDFEIFMNTPPTDKAMDRAQQDMRKIEVPETPTCDPSIGLLPDEYVYNPQTVRRFIWNPAFRQRMKQDAGLAQQALRQNSILCSAKALYIQEILLEGVMYPTNQALQLLRNYIRHTETKKAVSQIKTSPLSYLRKLGRVQLYINEQPLINKELPPDSTYLRQEPQAVSAQSKKNPTHFTFKLGWFSVEDEEYILTDSQVIAPLLQETPQLYNK